MKFVAVIILMSFAVVKSQVFNETESGLVLSARGFGRSLMECMTGDNKFWQCLGTQAAHLIDVAALDNRTWHMGDYLSFEKDEDYVPKLESRAERSLGNNIGAKLLQLMQTRALRMRLPPQSISDAIDEFSEISSNEGRKKKDKDKHMAMMGGMIMIATFAQMFLGKVILIAGAAFVMAKMALFVSILGSLKKGSVGQGSGSTTEHVIVSSGGHSHESGWHRRMPHSYSEAPHSIATEHIDTSPPIIESTPPHQTQYYTNDIHSSSSSTDETFKRRKSGLSGFL